MITPVRALTIGIAFFAFAFLVPVASHAQSASDIERQIRALQEQLSKLNATTAASATSDASVSVVVPRGGESFVAGSEKRLRIGWESSEVPARSIACTYLVEVTSGREFAFPADDPCTGATNGERSRTGKLVRSPGYDLGPGQYWAVVRILGPNPRNGKDREMLGEARSALPIALTEAEAVRPVLSTELKVIVPRAVSVGKAYEIRWSHASGTELKELIRRYPNASLELIAYHENEWAGMGQTIAADLIPDIILDGKKEWNVGAKLNDGRLLVAGNYRIQLIISVPNGVGGTSTVGFGRSDPFAVTTSREALGTYIGYLDLRQFIRTENITEAAALANCKLNVKNNPGRSVRCLWNDKVIYWDEERTQTNPVVIHSFTASEKSVTAGKPVTFKWSSNLTDYDILRFGAFCGISAITSAGSQIHVPMDGAAASGSVSFKPTLGGAYTLRCSSGGKDGSPSAQKTVRVEVASSSVRPVGSITSPERVATANPVITGTANQSRVGISIDNGDKVYGSGSIVVKNGTWSHVVATPLAKGSYTVVLYSEESDKLATKSLVVTAQPSTKFDSASTSPVRPTSMRETMLGQLLAGVGAVFAELPREFLAIFTR